MGELTYIKKIGAEITSLFEDLAKLRIEIFNDFPYLYEGSLDYEKEYLKIYSENSTGFVFAAYDGNVMVGATTCISLAQEAEEVQAPFVAAGYDLNSICYFGESILKHNYRGQGIGHRFFDEREKYAQSLNGIEYTSFCAVERPDNHPLKPVDYRPNDNFWTKRGYKKDINLQTEFSWPDIGEKESTSKVMTYWIRPL